MGHKDRAKASMLSASTTDHEDTPRKSFAREAFQIGRPLHWVAKYKARIDEFAPARNPMINLHGGSLS